MINDAIINYLSSLNIQFYHFVFYGTPAYIFIPLYLFFSGQFKLKMQATNYYIPLLRGVLLAPLPCLAFIALNNITLPEYTTIFMSAPIFAVILSIFFLKEKLNMYILISIIFGFIGILFVIQPGFETFNFYFLLALLGVFLTTLTTVIVNKYDKIISTVGYFVYGGIFAHLFCLLLFINNPLKIDFFILLLITFASILVNLAIYLYIIAFKYSQKFYASIFCLTYLQILSVFCQKQTFSRTRK